MVPLRFYIVLMGFFLAALVFGVLFFVMGMDKASYLINDGMSYGLHYIDKPSYDTNLQGLIFTLSFLAAGILLLMLAILPGQQAPAGKIQALAPPQPKRRPAVGAQPQAASAPEPQAPPETQEAAGSPTVEIEPEPVAAGPPSAPPKAKAAPKLSVDEEVLTSSEEEEIEIEDLPDSRYEDTGEEDVVYGTGRVTDDSIWEFIHNYPDSAVKFLYRKTLENKALLPNEEDIYRRWEMRGMNRSKVREFVLEIMGWSSLPDDFPHNIWRYLRDQIFEIKSRAS